MERINPNERDAVLEARRAAAVEEHRLWWAEETARTALYLSRGEVAGAMMLLRRAMGELEFHDGR